MTMKNMFCKTAINATFVCASLGAHAADGVRWGEGIGFYVGIDGQSQLASGTYTGLANPNAGRLTLLLDHGNHFHSIGAYSYSGTAAAPMVQDTNANNRIPEIHARTGVADSALHLSAGTGDWAGSLISRPAATGVNHDYGHLGLAAIQSLDGGGEAAQVLYQSSNGRWNGVANDVQVGIKLESITPGLKVSAKGVRDIFAAGNVYALGDLGSLSFLPTFHVDGAASSGVYSASMSLVNLGGSGAVGNGGVFHFDFAVAAVPEPSQWALMLSGLAVVGWLAGARRVALERRVGC